jgi:hypothetical protein
MKILAHDSMDEVVEKFISSENFNLVAIDKGKYRCLISRVKVYFVYREYVKLFSND